MKNGKMITLLVNFFVCVFSFPLPEEKNNHLFFIFSYRQAVSDLLPIAASSASRCAITGVALRDNTALPVA